MLTVANSWKIVLFEEIAELKANRKGLREKSRKWKFKKFVNHFSLK